MPKAPPKTFEPSKRAAAALARMEAMTGVTKHPMKDAVLVKVLGKMFAILWLRHDLVILKCDPHLADMMRQQFEGVGHRSHLDPRFWIAVQFNADVPAREITRLIAHSYDQVSANLTKKQQSSLAAKR